MSTSVKLQELLEYPLTLALAREWIAELGVGDPQFTWENLWHQQVQPHTDPLCTSIDWKRLKNTEDGKMFGLLTALDQQGQVQHLKAYSGQLQGAWLRMGWAPPLFDPKVIAQASWETQTHLHVMNRLLTEKKQIDPQRLKQGRRQRSQELTMVLLKTYHLKRRIQGKLELQNLSILWPDAPLGTGDCCAPKLLSWAAELNLTPLGLVEFWWGKERASYRPGGLYPPCSERCAPILPWLLGER